MKEMLNKLLQSQVRDIFFELREPVKILLFRGPDFECEYCQQTEQLLKEVSAISDKLELEIFNNRVLDNPINNYRIENVPTTILTEKNNNQIIDHGIRFVGFPGGHEFSSLIYGILMISRRDSGLNEITREYLVSMDQPLLLQVFVTPTCPYCPQTVILAHQMAYESPLVNAEMIEATEFPDLSGKFGVSGVPHTVINGGIGSVVGAASEEMLLQKIKEIYQSS